MNFASVADQLAIIRRGVDKIVPEEDLAKQLEFSRVNNRPLRIRDSPANGTFAMVSGLAARP